MITPAHLSNPYVSSNPITNQIANNTDTSQAKVQLTFNGQKVLLESKENGKIDKRPLNPGRLNILTKPDGLIVGVEEEEMLKRTIVGKVTHYQSAPK